MLMAPIPDFSTLCVICNPVLESWFQSSLLIYTRHLKAWFFQSLQNRLLFMQSVNFDWYNERNEFLDDRLRVELRKAFFPYIALAETTEKPDQ